jgi:hypothetical protein
MINIDRFTILAHALGDLPRCGNCRVHFATGSDDRCNQCALDTLRTLFPWAEEADEYNAFVDLRLV